MPSTFFCHLKLSCLQLPLSFSVLLVVQHAISRHNSNSCLDTMISPIPSLFTVLVVSSVTYGPVFTVAHALRLPNFLMWLLTALFAQASVSNFDGLGGVPGGWFDHHWIQLAYQLADSAAGFGYSFVMTVSIPRPLFLQHRHIHSLNSFLDDHPLDPPPYSVYPPSLFRRDRDPRCR